MQNIQFLKNLDKLNIRIENDILKVGSKKNTTNIVTDFYKVAPFPNYNGYETKTDILQILNQNTLLKDLKNTIGFNKKFIEVGSGTSQLSIALAIGTNNEVIALDPTLESLELGLQFASQNKVSNVRFLNADLFEDPIEEEYFDFVWCSGVLHHTANSFEAFKIISRWVKPGGIIIIGLYNKYGRIRTNLRQLIYKALGGRSLARKVISKLIQFCGRKYQKQRKKLGCETNMNIQLRDHIH